MVLTIFTAFTCNAVAQTKTNKLEMGFSVNQFHQDFGLGIHLISPYFLHSKVAVKAGASLQWFEHYNGIETTWTPYQNFQLGLRSRNTIIQNKMYIYGEGGLILLLPNSDFSSRNLEFGGYGLFGFEFKPSPKFAYFVEIGGVGTGANADIIIDKPIYSNGLLINVGFRIGI